MDSTMTSPRTGSRPLIDLVAGARPNFIKLAPLARALGETGCVELRIVHTGQHYDANLSEVFFVDLGIPLPDVHLEVGSGTQGVQTARILERYEALLLRRPPAATVVFGDVNSTVACALAATKLGVPVAHVEAGLRSGDRSMPEEINRILTDAVATLLFVTEPSGVAHLRREGVPESRIRLVGNVMIDTLLRELPVAQRTRVPGADSLAGQPFGLVTLHRPSNVDRIDVLRPILAVLAELSCRLPLVFPVHPRTRDMLARPELGIDPTAAGRMTLLPALPYHQHLSLMASAAVVLTDSGGMQEETAVLGVPCLTLRESTERPITVELGTSRLVGRDPERIRAAFQDVMAGTWPQARPIPLWDGKAACRIAEILAASF
ncbi:MAG: non-hydrolyzing UDP-N-acetylglucosamine 2-epimerase [Rhodospirillaceae bacterium]